MSVAVFDHQPAGPLTFEGAGGSTMILQTGTIIFNFQGDPGQGWIRDRLTHAVLDLPPTASAILTTVRAIASAAPSSMSYAPYASSTPGSAGLFADGLAAFNGFADLTTGYVNVGGRVRLPVVGTAGASAVSIPPGGWAVDRTAAARVQNHIQLSVDLAVQGPSNLFRLAYSLFVTIAPTGILSDVVIHAGQKIGGVGGG